MAKKEDKESLSVQDYERLGRTLESIFEAGYVSRARVYKINFVRGIFFGLGSLLGGTILLALLLWALSLFSEVPLVGEFAERLRESVNQEVIQ